ncbi:MAG: peptide chain release factor N(5)-glutamine methyltransferase [Bacteroidaceae bacterium]|nr:peptide chain release factor N(5)-glutamine methyltransferase [Bacteroidaceae bacterium]
MNALQKLQQRCGSGEGRALYELIMERRFGLSRTDILLGKDTTLSAKDNEELQIIVDRVAKGEPVQYVLGSEEFCGREFLVRPGVLIPRPETQQLVRLVRQNVPIGSTVLDIGTGSGCIAITLALAGYKVTALDVSDEALAVAKQNAERLGAEVEFVKADIIQCSIFNFQWSAIVSNPPYICESEAAAMDANVLDHEPHLALFVPDDDPLLFYKAISEFGQEYLADSGLLFFEVNRAYAEQVAELLLQKGYEDAKVVKDDYENNRFVWARKIQD